MKDKEIILLTKIINKYMEREIELLKRLPFEDLSVEEQGKIVMSKVNF